VQPVEPLEFWRSDPFEPVVVGEDLFARGAADDKGLALILIQAVKRFAARGEALPVNVKFLFEGEEESGGGHVARFLRMEKEKLRADVALLCDTEMFAAGLPTITTGLRGILYAELRVRTAQGDLHSGVYGGGAPNALVAAARMIAALRDDEGRLRIPGLAEAVERPSEAERASWATLPFDEEKWRTEDAKVVSLQGEGEYSLLERLWARPSLDVHGIRGGFTGEGAKTVIPAEATVKLSMRLVPGLDPERAKALLAAALEEAQPEGVEAELRILHENAACLVDPGNPFVALAAEVLTETFGRPCVYMRSGGSIPIVGLFQEELGLGTVMPGFGLPDDNLHAPNEKVHLPNVARGIDAIEEYFRRLGKAG
jgi:acetylornithine deacetylase/succinyl-diaminopimelate desuccinylase-like protein